MGEGVDEGEVGGGVDAHEDWGEDFFADVGEAEGVVAVLEGLVRWIERCVSVC